MNTYLPTYLLNSRYSSIVHIQFLQTKMMYRYNYTEPTQILTKVYKYISRLTKNENYNKNSV